jgi:hypothetical protein
MRKKVEREPDLVEFKINYTLDEDLPVEKYFMAYNSTDALKAFAQSCIKFLEEKNLSEVELNCFLETYAKPEEICIEKPELISDPKPIPELDEEVLKNYEEQKKIEVERESALDTDVPENSNTEQMIGQDQTEEQVDNFAVPVEKKSIVDPRIEHAELKAKREQNLQNISDQNKKNFDNYEYLIAKTSQRIQKINHRIQIVEFSEYFKWSDKWVDLPLPKNSN